MPRGAMFEGTRVMAIAPWLGDAVEPPRTAQVPSSLRHFIHVIRAVFLKGAGLRELWIQFVVLGVMAATTLAIATHRFRAALR